MVLYAWRRASVVELALPEERLLLIFPCLELCQIFYNGIYNAISS